MSAPCCARYEGRLVQERGHLAKLSRAAARRAEKGLDITANLEQIEKSKAAIADIIVMQHDHEAGHADDTH